MKETSMRDEIMKTLGELIFYSALYQEADYVDEILEDIKIKMEEKVGHSLTWNDIEHHSIEKDICDIDLIVSLYSTKEVENMLKNIKVKKNFEDVEIVNFDIEDFKKRYVKDFFSDDLYKVYIKTDE